MKKFIIPIVIVLILGFFYVYYVQTSQQGSLLQSENENTGAATIAVGVEIISLLNKLEAIKLDTALFGQPTFQSLKDFSITLRPQIPGRANPFAPIGTESNSENNATSQTQTGTVPNFSPSQNTPSSGGASQQNGSQSGASGNLPSSAPGDSDVSDETDDSIVPIDEGQ